MINLYINSVTLHTFYSLVSFENKNKSSHLYISRILISKDPKSKIGNGKQICLYLGGHLNSILDTLTLIII